MFVRDLIYGNIERLGAITANGSCRLLRLVSPAAVSAQGFLANSRTPRFEEFWPCSWSIKTEKNVDAGEQTVAGQARSVVKYEITLMREIERQVVEAMSEDRLELRRDPDDEAVIALEIEAVIPQQNGAWLIQAVHTQA